MCTIIGCFHKKNGQNFILKGLELQKHRGLDGFGIFDGSSLQIAESIKSLQLQSTSQNFIGHSLHAMVSHKPQPFVKKGAFITNCEIYDWQKIAKEHSLKVQNDAELLFELLEKAKTTAECISMLSNCKGVFATCYWRDDIVILARDILGEKPIHYAHIDNVFVFASEKKALQKLGYTSQDIFELNPRTILEYNIQKNELIQHTRDFFSLQKETQEDFKAIKKRVSALLQTSIQKQIPKQKIGVLFSGGIDSTIIAFILQKLDIPFTCYVAGLDGQTESDDVLVAKQIAEQLEFPLKVCTCTLDETQILLKEVTTIIESSNVIKVGVALPFYLCAKQAKKDGVKVLFSGLGSEEIFAGYQRHAQSTNINAECISGLRKMYERDLYRDDLITMHNTIELRLPFLDYDLVSYALTIPEKYKIKGSIKKYVLREVSKDLKLPIQFADRPKKAAQYGSKFDKAIEKLAKQNGFISKSAYLNSLYSQKNQRLAILLSGGKDSVYALYTMQQQQYPISCAITITSTNSDSYMYHTPNTHLTKLQAQSLNIPLIEVQTTGKEEIELDDLQDAMIQAQKKYQIEGIISGALYSTYQRERIEKIAEKLGLKVFSPLWHVNQVALLQQILLKGFSIIFTKIAAEGLDASWLGRVITQKDIQRLKRLQQEIGLHPAGEGGEFESFVIDGPNFSQKIHIVDFSIQTESENCATMHIHDAKLVEKNNLSE